MPKGYTLTQIILHWVVFLLVALQFILHDAISEAFRAFMRTGAFEANALVFQHVAGGILILAFVIWRMAIKARRGAPGLPENEPKALKLIANLTHLGLYGLLILTAASGMAAWFGEVKAAAEAHEVLKSLVMILVALHVIGALAQQFYFKSDVMKRMGKPEA